MESEGVNLWRKSPGPLLAKGARNGRPSAGQFAPRIIFQFGDTDIVSWLLTMLPTVAVMITFPVVVLPEVSLTTPADTVARVVLLEVQVATLVTSKEPLQVSAVAVNGGSVKLLAVNAAALVGIVIDWIHPTVTVTVCVPVIDGF